MPQNGGGGSGSYVPDFILGGGSFLRKYEVSGMVYGMK